MKTILAISGRGLNFANYVKTFQNDDRIYTIETRAEFEAILDELRDSKVHLVAGLGGTRGTGLIGEVTATLTQQGIDFSAYVTLPFEFEGKGRRKIAQSTLDQLIQSGYEVFAKDNNSILTISMITTNSSKAAFFEADKKLYESMEA